MNKIDYRNDAWNEARWYLTSKGFTEKLRNDKPSYTGKTYYEIAQELETEPIIVALLDNLGIMFACGDIAVEDNITEAIGQFVDIVEGDHWLSGYADVAYQIKPEFQKYFEKE